VRLCSAAIEDAGVSEIQEYRSSGDRCICTSAFVIFVIFCKKFLVTSVQLARNAMATRFEIVVHGQNEPSLRAAAEEALNEVQRVEAQLSLYRPDSEVAHLNARAAREWVRVELGLFGLLQKAKRLSEETSGAFDITVAPLMRCWGFMSGSGKQPGKTAIAEARQCVGMNLVELDPESFRVRFARPGVMLDFGAIGKGYAIERAVELLREADITSGIIHGGTSTAYGLGTPPDEAAWKIGIEMPPQTDTDSATPVAVVELHDEALSVSAIWGKSFQSMGKTYGHIIDPRTGYPAAAGDLAAVLLASATETDALSTALLTLGLDGHEHISKLRPESRTLVAKRHSGGQQFIMKAHRIAPLS
jgi:FAD:protein FMN transferase